MIALGDVIPWTMLAVMVAALVAGLFGRHLGKLLLLSAALFVLSCWFPQPVAAARDQAMRLHWFPVSLLLLILTVAGTAATAVIGAAARAIFARVGGDRRRARPNAMVTGKTG